MDCKKFFFDGRAIAIPRTAKAMKRARCPTGARIKVSDTHKNQPYGAAVGAIIGVGAGVILRLRWVGTLLCGIAAGVAAHSLGREMDALGNVEGAPVLLGPLGFAPVGALIGAVLAQHAIKDQLKGDNGTKGFWSRF